MDIQLKNIKHAAFASEETECFEATIYIDGVKAGTVSNEGHGGSNSYHPYALEARIDAYAKTLPPTSFQNGDETMELEMDADHLIGELFTEWQIGKDLDKLLKSKLSFTKADGQIYSIKPKDKAQLMQWLATPAETKNFLRGRGAVALLNFMPRAEALAIYRKGT